MAGVTLSEVYKSFGKNEVIHGISCDIEDGEFIVILGPSGCGKSTLALSLMGYYFPPLHYSSGEIIIDGRNITGMNPDEVRRAILGNEIAYIPQAAMNALNPTQKIIHFIEDVVLAHDPTESKKFIYDLARANFLLLGLPEEVLHKYPVELSGGMKQRTVIAVSVILSPASPFPKGFSQFLSLLNISPTCSTILSGPAPARRAWSSAWSASTARPAPSPRWAARPSSRRSATAPTASSTASTTASPASIPAPASTRTCSASTWAAATS